MLFVIRILAGFSGLVASRLNGFRDEHKRYFCLVL